jgi:methylenetetrahydrofolate reductase (NADPH)
MRIDERLLRGDGPIVSFEFGPPRSVEAELSLWSAIEELAALEPAFVSVTCGAGGSTRDVTLALVRRLARERRLEAVPHVTCTGFTRAALVALLAEAAAGGAANVLALRGDPPAGETEWTATEGGLTYSRELIELIRADYDFVIGAACFPEVHIHAESAESDLRYCKAKVDAGARFLITQLFFDNQAYWDFVARARDAGIDVPIVPGIMPIGNVTQIRRFTSMCGATIPDRLAHELALRADQPEAVADFGVAYATLQCAELLEGGAPGIHFYTLNRSPATRAILSALRSIAPWRGAVPV